MKKNIFFTKNNNFYSFSFFILFLIILINFIIFYININKKYFIIENTDKIIYYKVPDDREGERVKYINKKSLNKFSLLNNNNKLIDLTKLNYTIQLFSDSKYNNIENYLNDLLNLKSQIISADDLYIFSLESQIGIDYFLTYKNFNSQSNALNYCKKLRNFYLVYS